MSSTGGYVVPTSTVPIPGGLTLVEFIQTVISGISGITPTTLIRPDWQVNPPKQPDINTDWIAFGITVCAPDQNAYVQMDSMGNQIFQRHQDIQVLCSFYGPNAYDYANIVADGFQVTQNLEALYLAGMGYVSTSTPIAVPDLMNERWFNRFKMEVVLRRELIRVYPILPLIGAQGVIYGDGSMEFTRPWKAGTVPP